MLRWLWWTRWTWTTITRSTPLEPICFGGWAGKTRPRPPTSVRPPWRRRTPSGTSSGSVAELRADRGAELVALIGAYSNPEVQRNAPLLHGVAFYRQKRDR